MAENAVFVVGAADRHKAVAEGLPGNDVFGHDFKVEEAWFVDVGF